jgi:hypothetical protein
VKEGAGGLDSLRRKYSKPLYLLLTLVGLILALACANVANLLLARAAARRREIALRLSVGASRARVIRQLLTESVLLASAGGAVGVFLAIWGIRLLTLLLASGKANFTLRAELNWHVIGVAAALSLVTGVLFGLAPALQATRVEVMPALKDTRDGFAGSRRFFWPASLRQVLVAGQIAISLLMLFAAGLFVRTLSNLESIDLGFNRERSRCSNSTHARPDTRILKSSRFTPMYASGFERFPACVKQPYLRIRSSRPVRHFRLWYPAEWRSQGTAS